MAALEFFESIASLRRRVASLENQIESAYALAGPHGQRLGSIGGGGSGHDALAGVDAILDDGSVQELDKMRAKLEKRMDYATEILYGESGNGGIAKATCTDDADMLCFHYLQGESWASIARRYNPLSSNLSLWCKRHAAKVCREIDKLGMRNLADS